LCLVAARETTLSGNARIPADQPPAERGEACLLRIARSDLVFYDEGPKRFVINPGVFDIMVGSSYEDIRFAGQATGQRMI
jgi:hypothetical protein